MASTVEIEAHVMGHPKDGAQEGHHGQLGACPFSHRVLLILEEKQIPYVTNFVDGSNKPAWVTKANPKGTLPIIKDRSLDQFIVDSDTISDYLEEKYGNDEEADQKPKLGKVASLPHPGNDLMCTFMEYLKSSGDGAAEKDQLKEELKAINDAVNDSHPFMGGETVNAWDLALAPRLHIARTACRDIKGWDFADDFEEVKSYLHRMTGRPSWRNTASYDDEAIVADLRAKLSKSS
ncbi:hypothetical protein N2152v2_000260 [Parachlorella kessleri]